MKKILSLTAKELLSGLNAGGYFNESGGLWQTALGLNGFIQDDALAALVAGCSAAAEPGSGVVTDTIWAGGARVTGSNTGLLYLWGNGGKIYYVDLSGDNVVTDTGHAAVGSPAAGAGVFQVGAENPYFYYMQMTKIGRLDLVANTYSDSWNSSLQSTTHHPVHSFLDRMFFGNGYYIGHIYDAAGTSTANLTALDFPPDFTVTCLSDDGQYLVAGITKNKDTGSNPAGLFNETKIIFWDTNSGTWQKEYDMPFSSSIAALKKVGSTIYAICPEGIYAFNFGSYPVLVRELSNSNGVRFGFPAAIDQYRDGVIFGNELLTIGKPGSYAQRGAYNPFLNPAGTSGDIGFIWTNPRVNRIFVSTLNSKFYRILTNTNGAPSKAWKTKLLDLGGRFKIQQLEFFLGAATASGDAITVSVVDEKLTATTFKPISYANDPGVVRIKTVPDTSTPTAAPETELLGLTLTVTGGVPLIRKINVWGEPVVQT